MTVKKVAIVTGGGTGIGKAVSLRLAQDGFSIAIGYSQSKEGAESTVQAITNDGGTAIAVKVDIRDEDQVIALFQTCEENFGGIDVVINNAGVGAMNSIAKTSTEEYDSLFNLNARGTFFMCREAARKIRDKGRIINLSTGITVSSQAGMGLYAASKLAVEGLTKTLAHELGPREICANTVSPGVTDTPMLEGGNSEMIKQYGVQLTTMKRLGQAEDIADAISALVSYDGRWITGQNIHVDGGTIIT